MNPLQQRIELRRKRKEAKEKATKYFLVLSMVIIMFLIYGMWPRSGTTLVSPFESEKPAISQKMTEEAINIYPLNNLSGTSESIIEEEEEPLELFVEDVVEDVVEAIPKPAEEYTYNITEDERELLLKIAFCEANSESIECQMAVIQVILNRVESDIFPNSIHDVLYASNQFSPVGTTWFSNAEYNERNIEALERVLKGEKVISENVVFFWSSAVDVSEPGTWYYNMHQNKFCTKLDNTLFYYV